jgi:hypothetical protein
MDLSEGRIPTGGITHLLGILLNLVEKLLVNFEILGDQLANPSKFKATLDALKDRLKEEARIVYGRA